MAFSTAVGLVTGHNTNTDGSEELSTPQYCDTSESEDAESAVRLLNMDKRKPLEKDANDLTTDLDSDQQQQSFLNSTSSSSCSIDHDPNKLSLPPPQHNKDVKISFEASFSSCLPRRECNQGVEAAKQKYLQEKATKQQEIKATSEVLKSGNQTSEMSSKSSAPLLNRSRASDSPSSMSSTSSLKAAFQPGVSLPPQSSCTQFSTSKVTTAKYFSNRQCSDVRPNGAFRHPLPRLPSSSSYLSSETTCYSRKIQNNWAIGEHLFIKVCDLPDETTTRDLWTAFEREGHIAHIRLYENAKGTREGNASIKFRYASQCGSCSLLTRYSPPPAKAFWERGRYSIQLAGGRKISVRVYTDIRQRSIVPAYSMSKYPETMVRCLPYNASSPANVS